MTLLIVALIIVAAGAVGWYLGSMKVKEERPPAASSEKVTQPQVSAAKPESPPETSTGRTPERSDSSHPAMPAKNAGILPSPANQPVNPWKERDLES